MLYLFLYFVCCKLPHGKFTNSKTATETKYNTSETIGFARKAEQTPIIHYSFFIIHSTAPTVAILVVLSASIINAEIHSTAPIVA